MCSLLCELLLSKGVQSIRHAAPDAYYQLLLRGTPAQIAEALRHGVWSQAFFQLQLKDATGAQAEDASAGTLQLEDGSLGPAHDVLPSDNPVEVAAALEDQWRKCHVSMLDDSPDAQCKVFFRSRAPFWA